MNHQPFDNWIYDPSELNEEQKVELSSHIDGCPQCQQQQKTWTAVQKVIKSTPLETAPAGFHARFQASLSQRRALEQRKQSIILLVSLSFAFLTALSIILGILLAEGSLSNLLNSLLQFLTTAPERWFKFRHIITFWAAEIPVGWLITTGILMTGSGIIMLSAWTLTMTRIHLYGGIQK
mgnify:CR=1 FL=1